MKMSQMVINLKIFQKRFINRILFTQNRFYVDSISKKKIIWADLEVINIYIDDRFGYKQR